MKKIDWQKYRNDKEFQNKLIIILAIIALVLVSRNSISQIQNQRLAYMRSIIDYNVQKINDDKDILGEKINSLSSVKLIKQKAKDLEKASPSDKKVLEDCNNLVHDMKSAYFENVKIMSEKLKDTKSASLALDDFKSVVEENKYVIDYDNLIKEIEDKQKSVLQPVN